MPVSPTTKSIVSNVVLNINGADLKAKVHKCEYALERSTTGSTGILSLALSFEAKSKEIAGLLTDNQTEFAGVITCKNATGELVRTINFSDAVPISFSEAIDVKAATPLVSLVQLKAGSISVT